MARGILQSGDIGKQRAPVHYVMIVDDDPDDAQESKTILEQHGFETKIFKDGGQVHGAVAMDRPDLLLLKLILPGESGYEICERLKKHDRYLPVLIYTTIELEASRQLASKLGADGYLTRPCRPETLVAMIREVVDAAWDRQAEERSSKEHGQIRFHCKCGNRLQEKLTNRGKLVTCSKCQAMVQVPEHSTHEMLFRKEEAAQADVMNDPLRFVSVKCQQCGTFYKMFAGDIEKARICPKCGQKQIGALSIIGAPLSRAALASSLRVLRILSGKLKGKKLMLPEAEVTLGSDHGCQIRVYGEGVNPQHCKLKPTPLGMLIKDLGSEEGTYIDNERVEGEGLLEPGGLLRVGTMLYRLVGQNRDVNSTTFYDPKKARAEAKAAEKGVRLLVAGRTTAVEAAEVIQAHWDIVRKRSAMQLGKDTDVPADSSASIDVSNVPTPAATPDQ